MNCSRLLILFALGLGLRNTVASNQQKKLLLQGTAKKILPPPLPKTPPPAIPEKFKQQQERTLSKKSVVDRDIWPQESYEEFEARLNKEARLNPTHKIPFKVSQKRNMPKEEAVKSVKEMANNILESIGAFKRQVEIHGLREAISDAVRLKVNEVVRSLDQRFDISETEFIATMREKIQQLQSYFNEFKKAVSEKFADISKGIFFRYGTEAPAEAAEKNLAQMLANE